MLAPRGIRRQALLRRILERADWRVTGMGRADAVVGWGRKRSGAWAARTAQARGIPHLSMEDGFLRSVGVGVDGAPPLSIILDRRGIYYDAGTPSDLEDLILHDARLADPALLARAADGLAMMRARRLSKYNVPSVQGAKAALPPSQPFVVIVEQTAGDLSLLHGSAGDVTLAHMIAAARDLYPGRLIVVRRHPDVSVGKRAGMLDATAIADLRVVEADGDAWDWFEAADAVVTASSLAGFEALMAGRPVHVFGMPFYAGWGLTQDRLSCPRRGVARSLEQVFAAAYLLYPTYYDPFADRLTTFERVAEILDFQKEQAERHGQRSYCVGMSLWKQRTVAEFLRCGAQLPIFARKPEDAVWQAKASGGRVVVWASREREALVQKCAAAGVPLLRMEDGFLRSRGLGSDLVQPSSLVLDGEGIYYDPSRPSALERMIRDVPLTGREQEQAALLRSRIVAEGLSKYNVGAQVPLPAHPGGRRAILVPGQVSNDASVRLGAGPVADNWALLSAVRAENPDAFIVYKTHPDVEAGNRPGYIAPHRLLQLADCLADGMDSDCVLAQVDEVWTMTSLMGFEGLIRGKRVVCYGLPFYAGWGLTQDRMATPRRQVARSLDVILYCALVRYAAYTVVTPSGLRMRSNVAELLDRLEGGAAA
ncbi:capsular polysaccharide biosynthesis protein [Aureimonas frigidaquae]|uniref:Capsule polysaccharide biosynthesis protein n=1 Tax=Aureimonas frigidaquae TaxID=424757 RepID=A0A0P0Z2J1_9HYPH|nr:capsular polysaccharide biosynthesis protein [Aureimonas frigidaquae]BAT28212.1 capsule polysaccharide biosynthesis protein [Aureimonas frigidaquae]